MRVLVRVSCRDGHRLHIIFFNDTSTTEIYTLSLHDALPISLSDVITSPRRRPARSAAEPGCTLRTMRSEEHTSELQSRQYLVCRLLLEKTTTNGTLQ